MDFKAAVASHSGWKLKLARYIASPDGSLDPATVQRDNVCELGQWLHGEGRSFNSYLEYRALVADHARFHKAAADLVRHADRGIMIDCERAMDANSAFGKAARSIANAVTQLRNRIGG